MRLDLTSEANLGVSPYLRLYFETAAVATGPWTTLQELYYHPDNWQHRTRVVVAGFDTFVRLRWSGGRQYETTGTTSNPSEAKTLINPGFVIGLSGDGKPDSNNQEKHNDNSRHTHAWVKSISGHKTDRMVEHYSTISGAEQRASMSKVVSLFDRKVA